MMNIEIRQKYGIAAERRAKKLRLCDEAIYLDQIKEGY